MAIYNPLTSKINRLRAQIKQLKEGDIFSQEDIDILLPQYEKQLESLLARTNKV